MEISAKSPAVSRKRYHTPMERCDGPKDWDSSGAVPTVCAGFTRALCQVENSGTPKSVLIGPGRFSRSAYERTKFPDRFERQNASL